MDSSIFLGGSVAAAVIAGSIALFAPCCISVMLPAYFASAFQNRRLMAAMTFLFAAGIATVILPIALGAQALQRLIIGQHTVVYLGMGAMLVAFGAYTLLGGKLRLPMPGRSASPRRAGPFGVYSLGVFSGVASSCCAPVLAGVLALSGVASGFGAALGLGAAYVFGMVAPLFALALVWDRVDWRESRLLRPRSFTWRIGPLRRTTTGTALASGILLLAIGTGTIVLAFTSDAMPSSSGWQTRLSAELQHYGVLVTDALGFVPGWAGALVVAALVAGLGWLAIRQLAGGDRAAAGAAPSVPSEPGSDAAPIPNSRFG